MLCGLLHSFLNGSEILQRQVKNIWDTFVGSSNYEDEDATENDDETRFGRMGLLYKNELLLSANDYKRAVRFQRFFFGCKLPPYSLVQSALAQSLPSNSHYRLESSESLLEILTCFQQPQRILSNKPSENLTDVKVEREKSLFHHSQDNSDPMDPCSIQLNFMDSSYSMIMVTGRVLYNLLNLGKIRHCSGVPVVTVVLFRDGTDKIEMMNLVADRLLPVAGFKVSMAITRIEDQTGKLIYMREKPCSQYHVQPLSAAFLDENDVGSLVAISKPFEEEAKVLRKSRMIITAKSGIESSFSFKVKSVPDKKSGNKRCGMQYCRV